jgi:hypothetical protein
MSTLLDQASLIFTPNAYKAGTLYSVKPEDGVGDFDFTRATTATRVNSAGLIETVATGVPRLDYPFIDGVVQGCPSVLLEPARTNLITYSEDFTDASWTKTGISLISNNLISPDGTLNATKIVESSANSQHKIQETTVSIVAGDVIFSQFIKKGERSKVALELGGGGGGTAKFDLNSGFIISESNVNAKITKFSDDWYKCSVSFTSTASSVYLGTYILNDTETGSYQGDGTSGIYIWGSQVEQASYATSYIPTSGSSVTRNADVANGAGDASTFNDSEGVLFAEISALADDSSFKVLSISDGTTTNNVGLGYRTASNVIYTFVGSTINSSTSVTVSDITLYNKVAVKYKSGSFAMWINGFEQYTNSTAFSLSGMDKLNFDNGAGNTDFYGNTKQLLTFKEALTDAELENLTSWDSFIELAQGQQYIIY